MLPQNEHSEVHNSNGLILSVPEQEEESKFISTEVTKYLSNKYGKNSTWTNIDIPISI